MMGTELVSCIQTLGHLRQYLKWGRGAEQPDYTGEHINGIKNTSAVFYIGDKNEYKLYQGNSFQYRWLQL